LAPRCDAASGRPHNPADRDGGGGPLAAAAAHPGVAAGAAHAPARASHSLHRYSLNDLPCAGSFSPCCFAELSAVGEPVCFGASNTACPAGYDRANQRRDNVADGVVQVRSELILPVVPCPDTGHTPLTLCSPVVSICPGAAHRRDAAGATRNADCVPRRLRAAGRPALQARPLRQVPGSRRHLPQM
jgi:hypothetical protein